MKNTRKWNLHPFFLSPVVVVNPPVRRARARHLSWVASIPGGRRLDLDPQLIPLVYPLPRLLHPFLQHSFLHQQLLGNLLAFETVLVLEVATIPVVRTVFIPLCPKVLPGIRGMMVQLLTMVPPVLLQVMTR